jgi:MATE family multidrug resistance protein
MPTPPQPIEGSSPTRPQGLFGRSPFSSSFLSASPLAQESIERDIREWDDAGVFEDEASSSDEESEASTIMPGAQTHSMASSYRRPSFVAFGQTRPTVTPSPDKTYMTKKEKSMARKEERSLLRDNHLAPPKHPERARRSVFSRIYRQLFSTKRRKVVGDGEAADHIFTAEPSETSALLPHGQPETARDGRERCNRQWEAAVAAGKIKTTWQREAKTLFRYSSPLIVTFILQYSLTVASIFTVGHLGKVELGAVRYV